MEPTDHTGLLTRYEEFVRRTSFFPQGSDRERWGYLGTATGGEAGELLNEIKKLLRDDGGVMTSARQSKLLEEAGDVLWYLTAVIRAAGGSLVEVIDHNIDKLTARGNLAKTVTYGMTHGRRATALDDAASVLGEPIGVAPFPAADGSEMYALRYQGGNVVYLTDEQYADHVAAQEHNARLEAELGGM